MITTGRIELFLLSLFILFLLHRLRLSKTIQNSSGPSDLDVSIGGTCELWTLSESEEDPVNGDLEVTMKIAGFGYSAILNNDDDSNDALYIVSTEILLVCKFNDDSLAYFLGAVVVNSPLYGSWLKDRNG